MWDVGANGGTIAVATFFIGSNYYFLTTCQAACRSQVVVKKMVGEIQKSAREVGCLQDF